MEHLCCNCICLTPAAGCVMFRVIFPHIAKDWDYDEVMFKTYISSAKTFDFGPLLAGRVPEL